MKKMKDIFKPGTNLYIRTVTYHQIGRLEGFEQIGETTFAILSEAVWVADSGRFTQAMREGKLNEVELFSDGPVAVNLGAVSDICEWKFDLPSVQK